MTVTTIYVIFVNFYLTFVLIILDFLIHLLKVYFLFFLLFLTFEFCIPCCVWSSSSSISFLFCEAFFAINEPAQNCQDGLVSTINNIRKAFAVPPLKVRHYFQDMLHAGNNPIVNPSSFSLERHETSCRAIAQSYQNCKFTSLVWSWLASSRL